MCRFSIQSFLVSGHHSFVLLGFDGFLLGIPTWDARYEDCGRYLDNYINFVRNYDNSTLQKPPMNSLKPIV